MKSMETSKGSSLLVTGIVIASLGTLALFSMGGMANWFYLNAQETQTSLTDGFSDYLSSYGSAFLIAGIEIASSYYFIQKYDLGNRSKMIISSALIGVVGSVVYVIGEIIAGLPSFTSGNLPIGQLIYNEYSPTTLNYGNALIIFLSVSALVLLLKSLLKINPLPKTKTRLSKGTGIFGGVWTSSITTFSAMVCCGPLPGAIALATGVSSIYFTTIINLQPFLVLISVPMLLFALFLADRRAKRSCKLRYERTELKNSLPSTQTA